MSSAQPLRPHEITHTVRGFDCGYGGPFRPLSLANYFQESAGIHASVLGIGMHEMFANGRTWMLSRIDIRAEKLPTQGDSVTVRTWPAGTDRLFALRYLELLDSQGRQMAGALYQYIIVDIEKRRPLRPERILSPDMVCNLPPPYADLSPGLSDFPEFDLLKNKCISETFIQSFQITAGARHIDYNGHVNNGHIIDWLCDAIPLEKRGTGRLARLKVDFLNEIKLGQQVTALWAERSGFFSVLTADGVLFAKAFTEWH